MIKKIILNIPYNIKKYCYCKFIHDKYKCFPEVWGRGLKGPWHCAKCHPCGESLMSALEKINKEGRKK